MQPVTYEIAKKLNEKGFRERCIYHYVNSDLHSNNCYFFEGDKCIADDLFMSCNSLIKEFELLHKDDVIVDAPFISQVLEWLRKDKNIQLIIF